MRALFIRTRLVYRTVSWAPGSQWVYGCIGMRFSLDDKAWNGQKLQITDVTQRLPGSVMAAYELKLLFVHRNAV